MTKNLIPSTNIPVIKISPRQFSNQEIEKMKEMRGSIIFAVVSIIQTALTLGAGVATGVHTLYVNPLASWPHGPAPYPRRGRGRSGLAVCCVGPLLAAYSVSACMRLLSERPKESSSIFSCILVYVRAYIL